MAATPFYKRPVYVVGMLIGVVALFMLTQPQAPSASTKKTTKTSSSTAKKAQNSDVLPLDYTTKLPPLQQEPANVFKPLISKTRPGGSGGSAALPPSGVPSALAAGEGAWVYSGMAVVDGRPTGLLENPGTGDSVFLKVGERWKTATVLAIKAEEIVLAGPEGNKFTVKVREEGGKSGPSTTAASPNGATGSPLVGDIGNPVASGDNTTGNQGGRRRRGRRNQNNGDGNGF